MAIEQTFTQVIVAKTTKKITETMTERVSDRIGKAMVEIERARLMAGFDVYGKPFKSLNKKYKDWKQRIIDNNYKVSRKNKRQTTPYESNYMKKIIARKIADYGATKVNDKLRLTGELAADLNYRIKSPKKNATNTELNIIMTVNTRSNLKAKGLLMRGFMFFGTSRVWSWQQKERNAIKQIIKEESKGLLEAKF